MIDEKNIKINEEITLQAFKNNYTNILFVQNEFSEAEASKEDVIKMIKGLKEVLRWWENG